MSQQVLELHRVTRNIGETIMDFCHSHRGQQFRASELRDYVAQNFGQTAPASADGVLRNLKAHGLVDYRLVSRRESLYEVPL
jgi:hypothetical protein